jgi:hypothetical protein
MMSVSLPELTEDFWTSGVVKKPRAKRCHANQKVQTHQRWMSSALPGEDFTKRREV